MSALDKLLKDKRSELSKLKREQKKMPKSERYKLNPPIEKLEEFIYQFSKVRMEPRRVEHLVINYKLYIRFLKKLKGFKTKVTIKENSLLLQYGRIEGDWIGTLELYDLTKMFEKYEDGTNFPKAEIDL